MHSDQDNVLDDIKQPVVSDTFKKYWVFAILGFAIVIFLASLSLAYLVKDRQLFSTSSNESVIINQTDSLASQKILVDVQGAVVNPGTYWLTSSDRVEHAIAAAGGFDTESVDKDFVARELNLAAKIADGQKIYILHQGEDRSKIATSILGASSPAKLNVNTASAVELQAVGLTATMANKVVSKRPYQSLEDLVTKKALTKTQLAKFQSFLWAN